MTKQERIEFLEKWIAALRSGEYKQCTLKLHDGRAYCCLGVGLEVLGWTKTYNNGSWVYNQIYRTNWPIDLYQNVFNDANGRIDGMTLIAMNDLYEMTFEQIADKLESYLTYERNLHNL